ncbi:hypothetical protein D5H75_37210 [Bailinhaonella thermotolerans]|uniref:Uncharacterized protein n=1 Tax=Bailinhaonella thermotolerans TaxID=1070861 RepID=A0A3A4A2H9_9ACTN|nr:hypothetical protein D5H75_37210 [Bailinhaonella thermotolerans]
MSGLELETPRRSELRRADRASRRVRRASPRPGRASRSRRGMSPEARRQRRTTLAVVWVLIASLVLAALMSTQAGWALLFA